MDSHLSVQKTNQLKRRREIPDTSYTLKKTEDPCLRTGLWDLLMFVKSWIGIMRDLLRTDPKQMELQKEMYDE